MSLQELQEQYISFPEIAKDAGVTLSDAHNWANYHRFFSKHNVLGKPLASRAEYEEFKRSHPELIKTPAAA